MEFSLPLAVDMHFSHFDRVAHFESKGCLVIGIGYTSLFDTGVGGQLALDAGRALVRLVSLLWRWPTRRAVIARWTRAARPIGGIGRCTHRAIGVVL